MTTPATPQNPTSQRPVALVTGASRGIGAEIARRLARAGYFVWVNYSKSAPEAEAVVESIRQSGGEAEAVSFNVADPDQVDAKIEACLQAKGPVSVLVNNAGVNCDALILRLKAEDVDRVLNTNLKGAIYCSKAVSKAMLRARTPGSIINISSVVGEMGNAGQSVYAATKAGLLGFTKSLARELASRQVRVNAITPGFIETEMTGVLTDVQKEAILRSIPLGTLGTSADVAEVVAFLASSGSRYITGQTLGVNGGMYM